MPDRFHSDVIEILGRTVMYVITASNAPERIKLQADYVAPASGWESTVQSYITAAAGGKILMVGSFVKAVPAALAIPSNTIVELHGSITNANNINADSAVFTNSDLAGGNVNIEVIGGVTGILVGNEANQTSGSQCGVVFKKVNGLKVDLSIRGFRTLDMQIASTCSRVERNNRLRRQGNNLDVQLINDCSSTDGWTAVSPATVAVDTTRGVLGTASLKFTATSIGNLRRDFSPALDLSNRSVRLWVRFKDEDLPLCHASTHTAVIGFYSGSKLAQYIFSKLLMSDAFNGFICIETNHPHATYSSGFTDPDWTSITRIQLWLGNGVGVTDVWVGGMDSVVLPQTGAISITFDDNLPSVYSTAMPMMAAYGFKAGNFVNTDRVGGNIYMTWQHLLTMQNLGWEFYCHQKNHLNMTTLTPAENHYNSLYLVKDALFHSINKPWPFMAFPFGAFTQSREFWNGIRGTNVLFRTVGGAAGVYATIPTTPGARLVNPTGQLRTATYLTAIEQNLRAAKYACWQDVYLHTVGAGLDIGITEFAAWLAFLSDFGIPVKLYSEIVKDSGIPTSIDEIIKQPLGIITAPFARSTPMNVTGVCTQSGTALVAGANTLNITTAGIISIFAPNGGLLESGTASVTDSPMILSKGLNAFTVVGTGTVIATINTPLSSVGLMGLTTPVTGVTYTVCGTMLSISGAFTATISDQNDNVIATNIVMTAALSPIVLKESWKINFSAITSVTVFGH